MPEQHVHFGISHVLDPPGQIVAERGVGGAIVDRAVTGDHVRGGKRQMLGVVSDQQRPFAAFRLPRVGSHIEMPEGITVETDMHLPAFMRGQLHLGKALELAIRSKGPALGSTHIQLHDGRSIDIGIVDDGHVNAGFGNVDFVIREAGVAQTVTEREAHGNIGRLVISVAHKRAFAIDRIASDRRIPAGARAILITHRPGFGQMP